jgi:glycerol-3-phosphate dehydrogenase
VERVSVVVIGGGVVGCAVAAEAALRWRDVFVLEALPRPGLGASSRNSGVIHSGIYYPPGSLKARLCVEGNRLTYAFAAQHGVPHRRTGKLIVATRPGEIAELERLSENGRQNGLEGLELLDAAAVRQHEPHIAACAAIRVPSTGLVASEELVRAYARVAVERGAELVTGARVEALEPVAGAVRVRSTAGEVEARAVVNAAGLFADEVAALLGPRPWRIYPVRGEYCELVRERSDLVRGLVYPLPRHDGLSLGVHLTRTLWGTVLVGPTARYVADKNDYERDREPVEAFVRYARPLLPELRVEDLRPAYTGLRAKLAPPGQPGFRDFVIEADPQVPQVIHLIGIESPGLTAAPAIARHVAARLADVLD